MDAPGPSPLPCECRTVKRQHQRLRITYEHDARPPLRILGELLRPILGELLRRAIGPDKGRDAA